ncbi:NAD-dependent protein deacetylase sirtuin-2 [Euwallacea fornicatus]|uniref:NAD-dependent protein deacetylase sirtuin-2 n=1 Tax=Euwallacea fornicatus TaxID=995702 RepID=UPI00338D756E
MSLSSKKDGKRPSKPLSSAIPSTLKNTVIESQRTPPQVPEEETQSPDRNAASNLSLASLQKYLAEKLGLLSLQDGVADPKESQVLHEVSIDGIVEYIKKKGCKNVITMAGAGISTSAGIPDFRSAGTGLYHNLEKYNLPNPHAIFDIDYFNDNPKPFFVLAKELYPGAFKPTLCHYFIKLLQDKGLLLKHYTQNIDMLERVAGVSEDKLVEAHGTFYTGHCLECQAKYDLEWLRERIFNDDIPICSHCPGVVKPDIVFFGENLPDKFHHSMEQDFPKCDLLIILGSSLVVHPFAGLVDLVSSTTPRLLINREKVGQRTGIMAMMGVSGGLEFDLKGNTRDVAWLGDCDDGCLMLAEKLGWGDELTKLVKAEHEKIDKQKHGRGDGDKKPSVEAKGGS